MIPALGQYSTQTRAHDFRSLSLELYPNPRTYTPIHTPTVVHWRGRGWIEPHPGVFDMVQYLEMISPLVESL